MAEKYDAFVVLKIEPHHYVPTLVNTVNGAKFTASHCVCRDQVFTHVTRWGRRPMRFLGLVEYRNGELVPAEWDECVVPLRDPSGWREYHDCHGLEFPVTVEASDD